mgnify:FL=1
MSEGKVIAIFDQPRYVRKKPQTGAYIQCKEVDAEALVVNNEFYNLKGKTIIPDRPEVSITLVDGGEYLFSEYINKNTYQADMASIEDALCEIDMTGE